MRMMSRQQADVISRPLPEAGELRALAIIPQTNVHSQLSPTMAYGKSS